jgi:hypothetical protein
MIFPFLMGAKEEGDLDTAGIHLQWNVRHTEPVCAGRYWEQKRLLLTHQVILTWMTTLYIWPC